MKNHSKVPIGDLFRERRTAQRMTMREVAGAELSPTAVNNIEKGKIKPTVETVLYLCSVLDMPPELALISYPDFTKSAPALFEIVNERLREQRYDEAVTLLYDMFWVSVEQPGYEEILGLVQFQLGLVFAKLGRYACARESMNQAYYHFLAVKDIPRKIQSLYQIGNIELGERHTNVAIAVFKQALVVVHRYQHVDRHTGDILQRLADAHLQNLDCEKALQASLRAERVYRDVGAPDGVARSRLQQAELLMQLDALPEAERVAMQAYSWFAEHGESHESLASAARVLGVLMTRSKRYEEAAARFAEASARLGPTDCRERWKVECDTAELALCHHDINAAREHARAALAICDSRSTRDRIWPEDRAHTYRLLARCDRLAGDEAKYVRAMQEAVSSLQTGGNAIQAALYQSELADETHDWELMREAAQTLRRLHELPR
ncbi:helix-turn-helix domain-containing protein [Tumebacillus flagellatus]|uniref:HTH cro/C1-type domain-containing protein n=1 Tax=Tumebacillus flagellatus TaxID=1157490 RepID=A0A074LFF7_9BACL|nr:helix-turn-helix domain-containing protein [Tumebacillus flagellatus]KEO80976.1 hypothetical protein EL26_23120 [Tumebacillus flagellatus]